jgi:hypothetical protein
MQEQRLKRWMKILLSDLGLNPNNWHYLSVNKNELKIIYKHTYHTRTIQFQKLRYL